MKEERPTLRNKQAFEDALRHYEVSDHGKKVLSKTPFVAMSSVSGGGRNTIIRKLAEKYNYVFVVSDTTRPPKFRDGDMEQDGVNYYFRNEEDMLRDIQAGEFIEAEIIHNQQVSGTSIREIERAVATGKIPIHDFEYGGIKNVVKAKPDAVIIGLVPPSYDVWIQRLNSRETLHEQEFYNRLATAEKVLENMLSHEYFRLVVNDSADQCAEDIHAIVENDTYTARMINEGRKIAESLLDRVREELQRRV